MSWQIKFSESLKSLTLADLYREQDQYEHRLEDWKRSGYASSAVGWEQIALCKTRIGLLQQEINARYA